MKYLLMIVLLFSFGQVWAGGAFTGNELLRLCKARFSEATVESLAKGNTCVSYVAGVVDALFYDSKFCLPDKMPAEQFVRIAIKYMEENPEVLHFIAAPIVVRALSEAFPCE